jgi:hypothetical protein
LGAAKKKKKKEKKVKIIMSGLPIILNMFVATGGNFCLQYNYETKVVKSCVPILGCLFHIVDV